MSRTISYPPVGAVYPSWLASVDSGRVSAGVGHHSRSHEMHLSPAIGLRRNKNLLGSKDVALGCLHGQGMKLIRPTLKPIHSVPVLLIYQRLIRRRDKSSGGSWAITSHQFVFVLSRIPYDCVAVS